MANEAIYGEFRQQYGALWRDLPREQTTSGARQEAEVMIGGKLATGILTRNRLVVNYVPAFTKRLASGSKEHLSVGVSLEAVGVAPTDNFSFDLEDQENPTSIYVPRGPTAVRYRTDVFEVRLPKARLVDYLTGVPSMLATPAHALAGALITFNAAHAMVTASLLEAELTDFGTGWKIRAADVSLYLYDAVEGGNGIAQRCFEDWNDTGPARSMIQRSMVDLLRSTCCQSYCDLCVLLPRIPEPHVRGGLLDKGLGRAVFDAG